MKTKGVVLLAFGKRGYAFAAYNLAFSIKHFNPDIPVALLHDGVCNKELFNLKPFDHVIEMPPECFFHEGKFMPAKVKVGLYEYLPFDGNLYLDVDAIALKDIQPLIDELHKSRKYYQTHVVDTGGKADKIKYSPWATNDTIWEFFKLKEAAKFPSIQSSFCYIKKSDTAAKFFEQVQDNFEFPLTSLKEKWGGSLPDELIFSGTCAKKGLIPQANAENVLFFGDEHSPLSYSDIVNQHYILSLYGNAMGKTKTKIRYWEWYDRLMVVYTNGKHLFKSNYIREDKWANQRK